MSNIFEIATREKYRFPYKGMIAVEDLWDLSPVKLDGIYKELNAEKKTAEEESLLATRTKEDETLLTKLAIVKYIFEYKQAEIVAAKQARETAEKRRRLMELIASKEDDALKEQSVDDLKKMLAELG